MTVIMYDSKLPSWSELYKRRDQNDEMNNPLTNSSANQYKPGDKLFFPTEGKSVALSNVGSKSLQLMSQINDHSKKIKSESFFGNTIYKIELEAILNKNSISSMPFIFNNDFEQVINFEYSSNLDERKFKPMMVPNDSYSDLVPKQASTPEIGNKNWIKPNQLRRPLGYDLPGSDVSNNVPLFNDMVSDKIDASLPVLLLKMFDLFDKHSVTVDNNKFVYKKFEDYSNIMDNTINVFDSTLVSPNEFYPIAMGSDGINSISLFVPSNKENEYCGLIHLLSMFAFPITVIYPNSNRTINYCNWNFKDCNKLSIFNVYTTNQNKFEILMKNFDIKKFNDQGFLNNVKKLLVQMCPIKHAAKHVDGMLIMGCVYDYFIPNTNEKINFSTLKMPKAIGFQNVSESQPFGLWGSNYNYGDYLAMQFLKLQNIKSLVDAIYTIAIVSNYTSEDVFDKSKSMDSDYPTIISNYFSSSLQEDKLYGLLFGSSDTYSISRYTPGLIKKIFLLRNPDIKHLIRKNSVITPGNLNVFGLMQMSSFEEYPIPSIFNSKIKLEVIENSSNSIKCSETTYTLLNNYLFKDITKIGKTFRLNNISFAHSLKDPENKFTPSESLKPLMLGLNGYDIALRVKKHESNLHSGEVFNNTTEIMTPMFEDVLTIISPKLKFPISDTVRKTITGVGRLIQQLTRLRVNFEDKQSISLKIDSLASIFNKYNVDVSKPNKNQKTVIITFFNMEKDDYEIVKMSFSELDFVVIENIKSVESFKGKVRLGFGGNDDDEGSSEDLGDQDQYRKIMDKVIDELVYTSDKEYMTKLKYTKKNTVLYDIGKQYLNSDKIINDIMEIEREDRIIKEKNKIKRKDLKLTLER